MAHNSFLKHSCTLRFGSIVFGMLIGVGVGSLFFLLFSSYPVDQLTERDQNGGESSREHVATYTNFDLTNLTDYESDFHRDYVFFSHLSRTGWDEVVALFDQSQKITFASASQQLNIKKTIVRRLAELDARRALARVDPLPLSQKHPLIAAIYHEWSVSDLESAVNTLMSLNGLTKLIAAETLLRTRDDIAVEARMEIANMIGVEHVGRSLLSGENVRDLMDSPEAAWQAITSDDVADGLQIETLIEIAKNCLEQGGLEAVVRLAEYGEGWADRYWVVQAVIQAAISSDPFEAFEAANSVSQSDWQPDISNFVRLVAIDEIVKERPHGAIELIAQTVELSELERIELLSGLVETWASIEPRIVLDHLNQFPPSLHDQIKSLGAIGLISESLPEALELMKDMTNGVPKLWTAASLLAHWAIVDSTAALEWVMSDPDIRGQRDELIPILLQVIAKHEPERALELALQHSQEKSERVVGLDTLVVSGVAHHDADLAISLLPRVSDTYRVQSYREVSLVLVGKQEYTKAMRVADDLEDSVRDGLYEDIVDVWAHHDPLSMFEYIRKLPSREIQSKAALALKSNAWQSVLSGRELKQLQSFLTNEDAIVFEQIQ